MESVLKSQLNQLKATQKRAPVLPRNGEATFLFDFHTSKRVDVDTIYELGYSGLIELSRHNHNFIKFFNSLFNNTSKYFNRNVKRDEELKPIDKSINDLLYELVPYFRHKSTHRVIEYLIKIYNVNVYNAKKLFLAFLPYHESKFFIKLIQNINFENLNNYVFFVPYVKSGVVVLKEALYRELASNFNLLREILNFYEDMAEHTDIDDSIYFNFICEIFEFIIKATTKSIDINILTIILQFLNKTFKLYSTKQNISLHTNEDYEEIVITSLTTLIIRTVDKFKLNSEYSKAILNELVNKILPHLKNENSIDGVFKAVFIICEDLNRNKISVFKEDSINLMENLIDENSDVFSSIRRISDIFNIFTLILAIFNSTYSPKNVAIIKRLIKNIKFSDYSLEQFILYLFDTTCNNENLILDDIHKKDILNLLSFIDQISPQIFNNVLINIFTNKNQNYHQTYIEKVKSLTAEINQFYHKALITEGEDKNVNAFNLFINLNSTSISLVLYSIKKIDELIDDNLELIAYSVPFLANKFSFLDKEIILTEILNLNCLEKLIFNFAFFKKEIIEFYFNLKINKIKIYSNEFINKTEENVINFCFSETDEENSMKILICCLFFGSYENDYENYIVNLFKNNTYLHKIMNNKGENNKSDLIINHLCSQSNNLDAINFIKKIKDVLLQIFNNNNNITNLEIDRIIYYFNTIVQKHSQKSDLLIKELQILIEILQIEKLNKNIFEHITNILINTMNSTSSPIKIAYELSCILIKNNKFDLFDNFLKIYFAGNNSHIQVFLSNLILLKDITNPNFFNYINTVKSTTEEVTLLVATFYSILNPEIDSNVIFNNLTSENSNLTEGVEIYNIFTKQENKKSTPGKGKNIKKVNISSILQLKEEIINRKNEILINKNYLKKYITSKSDANAFYILNEIFIPNLYISSENLNALLKIFSLFAPNRNTQISNNDKLYKEELRNLYKNLIKEFSPDLYDIQTVINFNKLLENLFVSYLNIFPNSAVDILKLILDHQNKLKLDNGILMNNLFSRDHFNLEELKQNLELNFHIIKFAIKYSISSDNFISNDENYSLNLLDYINDKKSVLKEDELFTISFIFEIIFKNNNSYFNLQYVNKTLDLLGLLRKESSFINMESNSLYLNLTNNLLTIVSNCTVETEEKIYLKNAINEIEANIFSLIERFRKFGFDTSSSLEMVVIVNTLFLCMNKLISQFTNIEEEREIVKNLIFNNLKILNAENTESDLSQQVKEEIYIIFINAVRNFIELIFINHSQYLQNNMQQYEIFFEYIHYFVKFTITLINFKDKKIIEQLLANFIKIQIINTNQHFLACFFTNLFYYNFVMLEKENNHNNYKDLYSDIIFNFFNKDDDAYLTKLSLDIILSIFTKLNTSPDNIFYIESNTNKNLDPLIISLDLVNKILTLTENSLFNLYNLENISSAYQTLLEICVNIYNCRKNISNKMREGSKNEYAFQLKELKTFEENLFADMNDVNLLNETVLLIYHGENYMSDKPTCSRQMRNYMLTNYLDILISNKKNNDLDRVFDFFISRVINLGKEDRTENQQIIFAILTKIINNENNSQLLKTLKSGNCINKLFDLIDFSEVKVKNINYLFYQLSLVVFISKVFISFGSKFLDKFNIFMEHMLNCFDTLINLKNEEKSTITAVQVLTLETFQSLAASLSEFMSPYLKQTVLKLLIIVNNESDNDSVKLIVKNTLESIATKQILDVSLKTVKFCIKNFINFNLYNSNYPVEYLMNFFKISISRSDKIMIAGVYDKILKMFIKLLLNEKISSLSTTESILNCFKSFILKINEKQLKSMFADILKFGKEPGDRENDLKYKLENSIVAFQLLNSILKAISIIFVPYFEKYKNYWTDLLICTNTLFSSEDKRHSGKKKSRAAYDSAYNDEENKFSYLYLNTLLLENIRLNFINNTDNQLLNETIEDLTETLVGQLKFIFFENQEEKLMNYFDNEIKVTFVDIFKNIKSEEIFRDFNENILNLIREDNYLVKLLTLKMIKSLFESLKERYVMLITDIVPYITDCIEDSNEKVNIEAFNLMKFIEKTTGEDFKNYLDIEN